MGAFQATRKHLAVFLLLVACNDSLLTHGRQIKPLNQHSSLNKGTLKPLKARVSNVPTPSSENKKVDSSAIPKHGVASFDDSADTNAFRPTTPGSSPGVGHRKFEDKDVKAMVAVQSPDVKVYAAGATTNGFKPTDPGHSPGVGHSQQNKIGQLN
ncbi:precursor of CEP9-like [Abrus precatorius]|uniref:Precursor of CEP9-like n=1 Tax=Abrus precatorius TaxID=3816 RepID=A0A8B8KRL3_ABRPR|nr:precursor of CEP9-like [Abrus precatorius]